MLPLSQYSEGKGARRRQKCNSAGSIYTLNVFPVEGLSRSGHLIKFVCRPARKVKLITDNIF